MINPFERKLLELDEIQTNCIKKWEASYRLMSKSYCERTLEALLGHKCYSPEQPEKVAALRKILWH